MSEDIIRPFEEKMVSSALLEIPRNTHQRGLNPERLNGSLIRSRLSEQRMND